MTENYKQDADKPTVRIYPKKSDVLLVSILFLVCIVGLALGRRGIVHERQIIMSVGLLVCCIFIYVSMLQRASIDPRVLRYHILGLIPVEIYWYDVAQIGTVFISSKYPVGEKDTGVLGEMFVIVLKPCKKYEEGSRTLRWWHIRPKWRHPFLVKNIYCDSAKYKKIIEEYSRKKVSLEIKYR